MERVPKRRGLTAIEKFIIAVCLLTPIAVGFAFGWAVRGHMQPKISKREELKIMEQAIDRMAAVAKARAVEIITCGRCHDGRDQS